MMQDHQLEVRHTDAGSALLFFIGADGALRLAAEAPGSALGWQHKDLCGALVRRDHAGGRCTKFASARAMHAPDQDGRIHLAMVVSDGGGDHLYLSLSNRASDLVRHGLPVWTACPFDGAAPAGPLAIVAVRIGEADGAALAVVDLAGTAAEVPLPSRYYIDTGRAGMPRWVAHRMPVDAAATLHASCLGRSRGGWNVDGVYLACKAGDAAQLLYSPLYNPFNPALPTLARRFSLPGERVVETMATCRNADRTSELFVTAGGALYFFSAANQFDSAQALQLIVHPLFKGIRTLYAACADGQVTVWGLNAAGQVVVASVDRVYMAEPDRWHRPCVILSGVTAIAPCPDCSDANGRLFAWQAGRLLELAQAGDGSWSSRHLLPAPR